MFDASEEALCRAAAVRWDGALRVLAARAGLSDDYSKAAAGVEYLATRLDGGEFDHAVLVPAFLATWQLLDRHPAELPARKSFRKGLQVAFGVFVLTRPDQRVVPAQGLEDALEAAAAWPSKVRIDSFTRLADYERACQTQAQERLRRDGPSALREPAEAQASQYRRVAASPVG
ncbi:hypothetical protein ACWGKW_12290 [Streptomyces sp. NPDC054766]